MEFTSWFIGDLFNTINAIASMSSSMAGSVINILFLFVVFLLLFRAFSAFMHRKFETAGLNILYVFILGFLFLGTGTYYINYVNITGFTEDDSKRLDSTAPSTSMKVKVNGESNPPNVSLLSGKIDANKLKFKLDNIPNVYAIPAFMDEVAVSLAKAAGLDRSGDYYTLAVMRDPNVVFTMTANQMLVDSVKGQKADALCKFYQKFANCFEEYNAFKMTRACRRIGKLNASDVEPITEAECKNMIRQYGVYMQGFLDQTIGQYADKNDTYRAIYKSYSQMAQQLQNSDYTALPPPVKSKIEESLKNILTATEYTISKADDEGEIARKLTDPWFGSHLIQYLGMVFKEIMSSLGKSWLVQTLLVQNELVIFLSFYLLPLVVLITFLTNNFKYLAEYAFGYLLLKLQLPLWVIGHYLATGHVFNNLLASPTINGYLLELVQSGEINNSDILVNTVTAGITSLGIGSLFLFGKSAAGGIQQGVAAGGEILRGAMEIGKMAIQTGLALASGGAALAGQLGVAAAGAGKLAGGAASAAGSAVGGVGGGVGKALQTLTTAGTPSQFVGGMAQLASEGVKALGNEVIKRKFTKHPTTKVADGKGNHITVNNQTGAIQEIDPSDDKSLRMFMDTLKESGHKVWIDKNEETGKQSIVVEDVHGKTSIFKEQDGKFVFDKDKESNNELHINNITGGREIRPA
jgi:hypothetical protein